MAHESPGAPRPDAWRQGARAAAPSGPRWRQGNAAAAPRTSKYVWRLAIFAAASLAACLLWLSLVVWSPRRTPILVAACTGAASYREPFAPFALIQEDLDLLLSLHGKNVSVTHAPDAWSTKQESLELIGRQLAASVGAGQPPDAFVVYVAMHSDVDEQNRPCVIPSSASPLAPNQWLTVEDLLRHVQQSLLAAGVDPDHPKLIVFDCVRSHSDWRRGLLQNRFAERTKDLLATFDLPGFAVLVSAEADQVSRAYPQYGASLFGKAFQQGLAGAADAKVAGGNGDQAVSVHELANYVSRETNRAARAAFDAPQTCGLYTTGLGDFRVAWAIRETPQPPGPAATNLSPEEVDALWRRRGQIAADGAARRHPQLWAGQLARLQWLEQAAVAGADYRTGAKNALRDLTMEMTTLARVASPLKNAESYVTTPEEAKLFGLEEINADQTASALDRFAASPSTETLSAALAAVEDAEHAAGRRLAAGVFFKQLERMNVLADAEATTRAGRLFGLQRRLDRSFAVEDLRAQYFVDDDLHAAVGEVQTAADFLFALESGAAECDAALKKAETRIDRIEQNLQEVAQALAMYDDVSCRLPHALAWLDQAVRWAPQAGLAPSDVQGTSDQLIDDLDSLADRIATAPVDDREPVGAHNLAGEIKSRWATIQGWIDGEYRRLTELDQWDAAAVRDAALLAAAPLPPSRQDDASGVVRRRALIQRIDAALRQGPIAAAPVAADSADAKVAPLDWEPAAELMVDHTAATVSPPPNQPAEAAKFLRAQLRLLPEQATDAARNSENQRAKALMVAHRTRLAAAFPLARLETDPFDLLERIDQRRLELELAQRRLDEFWGPDAPGSPAYFAEAVGGYLRGGATALVDDEHLVAMRQTMQSKLAAAVQLAGQGLQVEAADGLVLHAGEPLESRVRAAAPSKDWPAGAAVLLVRDMDEKLVPYRTSADAANPRRAIQPIGGEEDSSGAARPALLTIDPAAALTPPVTLDAVAFFRGHEAASRFLIEPTDGPGVVLTDEEFHSSQATVGGSAAPAESLVLILDVSQTMSRPVRWEGPTLSGPAAATRLEAATTSLSVLLGDLSDRTSIRVGVRFFGHRVGWDVSDVSTLLQQLDYAGPPARGVEPSLDVESVLPLGRFDAIAAGSVRKLLGSLRPWGESPIHLAIADSAAELANEPSDVVKRIVVITDGGNYQSRNETPLAPVQAALSADGVQLNILYFQDDASEPGLEELKTLASTTGGVVAPVQQASDLLRRLQDLTRSAKFTVADDTGAVQSQVEVGQAAQIPLRGPIPRHVSIALNEATAPIELFGGEAIQFAAEAGRLIVPFDESAAATRRDLVDAAGSPSPWEVAAATPTRTDEGVQFQLVIRRRDGAFTHRPRAVWIEATPLDSAGSPVGASHVVYDPIYAPRTSLPTLQFAAAGWPNQAVRASIVLYAGADEVPPDQSVAVAPGSNASPVTHPLPGGGEIQIDVSQLPNAPRQLLVVGRYLGVTPQTELVRLLLTGGAAPTQLRRRMDVDDHLSVHEFTWASPPPAKLQLELWSKESITNGAARTARPLVVAVDDGDGLLPLTAPLVGPPPAPAAP